MPRVSGKADTPLLWGQKHSKAVQHLETYRERGKEGTSFPLSPRQLGGIETRATQAQSKSAYGRTGDRHGSHYPLTQHLELGTLRWTPAQSCTHREKPCQGSRDLPLFKQQPPNPQNPKKQSPQYETHRATFITSYQHLPAEAASPANYLHKRPLSRLELGMLCPPRPATG